MILIKNKKALADYSIVKKYIAGIKLNGSEVKSLRNKSASLKGSYIKIIDNEVFLINAQINPYSFDNQRQNYEPKRTRKLLLKRKEINSLQGESKKKGWSLVPLSFQLLRNKIKLEFGVGKGRKEYEKRERIKKRDLKRQLAKTTKHSKLNF